LAKFVADINLIFSRNGVAYELTPDGAARRLLPDGLRQLLAETIFNTGDAEGETANLDDEDENRKREQLLDGRGYPSRERWDSRVMQGGNWFGCRQRISTR
jgi:hypothetical protein